MPSKYSNGAMGRSAASLQAKACQVCRGEIVAGCQDRLAAGSRQGVYRAISEVELCPTVRDR